MWRIAFNICYSKSLKGLALEPNGLDILRRSLPEATHWLFILTQFWQENQLSRNELLRLRFSAGESLSELARAYDISPQQAYQIALFKRK